MHSTKWRLLNILRGSSETKVLIKLEGKICGEIQKSQTKENVDGLDDKVTDKSGSIWWDKKRCERRDTYRSMTRQLSTSEITYGDDDVDDDDNDDDEYIHVQTVWLTYLTNGMLHEYSISLCLRQVQMAWCRQRSVYHHHRMNAHSLRFVVFDQNQNVKTFLHFFIHGTFLCF